MTPLEMVHEFHDKFDANPMKFIFDLRFNILHEELNELQEAKNELEELDAYIDIAYIAAGTVDILSDRDMPQNIDMEVEFFNLQDFLENSITSMKDSKNIEYIVGTCASILNTVKAVLEQQGYDFDGAFAEVHRSNMSKLGPDGKPIKRIDGKVLKGPDFSMPDLTPFLIRTEK